MYRKKKTAAFKDNDSAEMKKLWPLRRSQLPALKAVPAPEAGIDFQTFLGNTGWGSCESATPRQAKNGVPGSSPPPSPSAPMRRLQNCDS
eukprot:s759_g20.t1